ncbi:neutral/alkaline non-lysosomal ceramidase N-terminal domain-containing protein [Parabacteroides sp. Marseille-P3160]|uniref:neutral/alkaline non-lysosomal ceramidase N-terminal domain-containing protein n=1 Tax=Parabacteroides sp. Marseille-P3160 TaxID=1917887 RepID=UPI0009BB005A|nr:neutral/alkaline non-lysosomal ceramidase N-terminal domain-containing protein [Parabacteroides sp. Marseille-P3160]
MTKIRRFFIFILVVLFSLHYTNGQELQKELDKNEIWKIGVAKKSITPTFPIWMAGYAARTSPSKGILHDLWAKALVLEDALGHRSILITMDLLSIPKDVSERFREKLKQKYGFEKSQIILSCSHTHSGPVVSRALKDIYPMSQADWDVVDEYTKELENNLMQLVDESLQKIQPARIYTQNGITRFQVNRRNNNASTLTPTTVLNGPNDYAVPVIKIEDLNKRLIAIVFGYACHPTVLSGNQICGDYAGFAQIELEKTYPGVTALFFQGAGADQNPLPRHTLPLAMQYGKELANAVERVLLEGMVLQESKLETRYKEINLPFDIPLSLERLQEMAKTGDFHARWAQRIIGFYERGEPFMKFYPYPIEYWKIGRQCLFILGGELVSAYSVKLKELFGQDIFVMGYANDVMGYIPSVVILEEGGYEGDMAQHVYGLPAKWDKQIESLIIENARTLAQEKGMR